MTHEHHFSRTGIYQPDGSIAAPCLVGACAVGLVSRTAQNLQPDAFPMRIAGVDLDIEDHPTGGVAKIVCREAEQVYRLQDIPFSPGDVVLDIGAHVGVVSCWIGKVHPEVRVEAFEPVPELFALLKRNLTANGVHTVIPLPHGVSGQGGMRTIYGDIAANSGGSSIFGGGNAVAEVKTMSLPGWIAADGCCRIKLLKIDCEGMEHEVLTDAVLARVDYLVGEFHDGPAFPPNAAADLEARCVAKLGRDRVRVERVRMG